MTTKIKVTAEITVVKRAIVFVEVEAGLDMHEIGSHASKLAKAELLNPNILWVEVGAQQLLIRTMETT